LRELFEVDWLAPHSTLPRHINQRLIIGPERARGQFTTLLKSAKRTIHIIDHKLDDPEIKALLKAKKAQGVDVQVLGEGQLGGLLSHGKLIIIDGRVAALGSMALSALSVDFRREVAVTVDDPKCVRKLNDFYRSLTSGRVLMEAATTSAAGDERARTTTDRATRRQAAGGRTHINR
jgi:phosphatidylserine/phosphatidylglycerophosphate/cardiolipin synthase-like enzyme